MAFKLMQQKKMSICRLWQIDDHTEVSHIAEVLHDMLKFSHQESAVISQGALEDWLMRDVASPKNTVPPNDSEVHTNPVDSSRQSSRTPDVVCRDMEHSSGTPLDPLISSPHSHPHCLDNSSIICYHGALDPRKASHMKRFKKV